MHSLAIFAASALLALAAGCWAERAPGAAGAAWAEAAPAPRVVPSCPIEPPGRARLDTTLVGWPGLVGDRSWIVLRRRTEAVIAGLGSDGALAELPIGSEPHATAVEGTWLWLARPAQPAQTAAQGAQLELIAVELGGARPVIAERATLPLAPLTGVSAIAVSLTRALVADLGAGIRLQLYDRRRGAPLGAPAVIASTDLQPPVLRCSADRCFALGVLGDGPGRRLFVERFGADGRREHEELAGDHLAQYRLAAVGDRLFAVWTSFGEPGVFARELNSLGRVISPRTRLFSGRASGLEIVPDPRRLRIAAKAATGWVIGELETAALGSLRTVAAGLPAAAYFLTGAAQPDGVVIAGFSSNVDYQGGFHSWSGRAWASFVGAGEVPGAALPLASAAGDGRAGLAGFPLVAPGRAAVIVVPQGPEAEPGGELISLRQPCAPP